MNKPCLVFYDKVTGRILHVQIHSVKSENGSIQSSTPPDLILSLIDELNSGEYSKALKNLTDRNISNLGYIEIEEIDKIFSYNMDLDTLMLKKKPFIKMEIDGEFEVKDGIPVFPGDGQTEIIFKCKLLNFDSKEPVTDYNLIGNIKLGFDRGRPVIASAPMINGEVVLKMKTANDYVEANRITIYDENGMAGSAFMVIRFE